MSHPGKIYLILLKKKLWEDVDTQLAHLEIKSMYLVAVLCSIEKDKYVNVLHRSSCLIL